MLGKVEKFAQLEKVQTKKPDTVLELNVLEHLKDDTGHLAALARYASDGKIVLFIPALESLYGSWDIEAGHFRRYNKKSMSKLFSKANLQIVSMRYFNGVGAILWFFAAKVIRMKLGGEGTGRSIAIFDALIIPFAKLCDPLLSLFFGQSLIVVAKTPNRR